MADFTTLTNGTQILTATPVGDGGLVLNNNFALLDALVGTVNTHTAATTGIHGAVSTATSNALVIRDGSGGAAFAALSATSLSLGSGNITNVGSLTASVITCPTFNTVSGGIQIQPGGNGNLTLYAGDSSTSTGGSTTIRAGNGSGGSYGGGTLTIKGGGSTGGIAGDLVLQSATGSSSGNNGNVRLKDASGNTLIQTNSTGIGFFGTTPAARVSSTFDLKDALAIYGLIQNGAATPLNLDGGTLTAGLGIFSAGVQAQSSIYVSDVAGNTLSLNPGSIYLSFDSSNLGGYIEMFDAYYGGDILYIDSGSFQFYAYGNQALYIDPSNFGIWGASATLATSVADLKDAFCSYGFMVNGGASPLDLDGGTLTAGSAYVTGTTTLNALTVGSLAFTVPAIGTESKFLFNRTNDSAWLSICEYSSDSTVYEFGMADNPDQAGDIFHWVMGDSQSAGSGWEPLRFAGVTSELKAYQHSIYGNVLMTGGPWYSGSDPTVVSANQSSAPNFGRPNAVWSSKTGSLSLTPNVSGYNAGGTKVYWVKISAAGSPNQFNWGYGSPSNAATGSGISITGGSQTLADGVTVTFSGTTGGAVNDLFVFRVYAGGTFSLGQNGTIVVGASTQQWTIGNSDAATGAWLRNDGSSTVLSTNVGSLFLGYGGNTSKTIHIGNGTSGVVQVTGSGTAGSLLIDGSGNLTLGASNTKLVTMTGRLVHRTISSTGDAGTAGELAFLSGTPYYYGTSGWAAFGTGGGASTLASLTDVQITSVAAYDILQYNGTKWANQQYISTTDIVQRNTATQTANRTSLVRYKQTTNNTAAAVATISVSNSYVYWLTVKSVATVQSSASLAKFQKDFVIYVDGSGTVTITETFADNYYDTLSTANVTATSPSANSVNINVVGETSTNIGWAVMVDYQGTIYQ